MVLTPEKAFGSPEVFSVLGRSDPTHISASHNYYVYVESFSLHSLKRCANLS